MKRFIPSIGITLKLCISQIEASTSPPLLAYPGHWTLFLAREGGDLITTHREWGIWSLASMSCYEINHGGDGGDVELWRIQRKRFRIWGGLVENQRSTQAVFRIWRCLRTIYFIVHKYVLPNKPCLHAQLQKQNRSCSKVKTVIW